MFWEHFPLSQFYPQADDGTTIENCIVDTPKTAAFESLHFRPLSKLTFILGAV
jgi:hypothetical protein